MNAEPISGERPSRDERITAWFERTRETIQDQEIALELARAEAVDDNDRPKLLRLEREREILDARITHLQELTFHISDPDPAKQIEKLAEQAARLDALLTQQNRTAENLQGHVTFRGGMQIDTDAAKFRAQLQDTRDLLLEYV